MKTKKNLRKHKKEILALLLCFAMVISMVPAAALQVGAAEDGSYSYSDDFSAFAPLVSTTLPTSTGWWITADSNAVSTSNGEVQVTNLRYYLADADKITEDYTMEFRYQLPSGGQATFKLGNGVAYGNSQVVLALTGGDSSIGDRIKPANQSGSQVFGGEGAWHTVKLLVSISNKTYQMYVDGVQRTFNAGADVDFPFQTATIAELNRITFECSAGNLLVDDFKLTTGIPEEDVEETTAPTEETTAPTEETTAPTEEPEETEPGMKTHLNDGFDMLDAGWTANDATVSDGILTTTENNLIWNFDTNITDNYTVEFRYQLGDGTTQEQFTVKVGNKPTGGQAKSHALIKLIGEGSGASNNDRVQINGVYTPQMSGKGQWHTIEIVVDQTNKTYQLYADGILMKYKANSSATEVTDIPYFGTGDTSCMNQIFFDYDKGTLCLDYVKVYTDHWTVTQQATLGENIHMSFTGSVSSYSGITTVQAALGNRVMTDADMSDGFAITLPVAPAEVAQTITLTGLNAQGDAVMTKTYTVADYLAEVKATDEATYGSIVDYTLNYAAAAAAYFGKTAVTAPEGLTLADVPAPAVEGNVTASNLKYSFPAVTDNYTLEFKYQVPSGESARVYVSNGNPTSATAQVLLTITGAAESDASGDRFTVNGDGTVQFGTSSNRAYGQWHTIKLVVDQTNDTCVVYLDGSEEPSKEFVLYAAKMGKTNPDSVNAITFMYNNTNTYKILIDDVKFTAGETEILDEDFSTFEPVVNTSWGTAPQGSWWYADTALATYNTVEKNPVSGSCAGIDILGATLLVKDRIEVRYYPVLHSGSISDYTFSINGISATPVQNSDGDYYVVSNGINPQNYGDDLVLTVTKGEETVSVAYNPMDYICRMNSKTENTALITLLQAMYNYHLSAVEYLNAAS